MEKKENKYINNFIYYEKRDNIRIFIKNTKLFIYLLFGFNIIKMSRQKKCNGERGSNLGTMVISHP